MKDGFILLSRTLLESDVFASQKLLKIWIWCLCKANFKDRSVPLKIGKGQTIVKVKRGSFIFGRFKAEEELFIDGSTVYKSIQKLQEMDMITVESNNQYSIITICKYDEYQQSDNYQVTSKEQPSNNQVTSKEQPSNTTKNDNNYKKDNNVNKEKKEDLPTFVGLPELKEKSIYTLFVDAWFENWKDYVFSKVDGSKIKNIIKQLQTFAKRNNIEPNDEEILNYWKIIIKNMPEFYKGKDLKTVDSKLNEIVNEIKTKKNGTKKSKYAS